MHLSESMLQLCTKYGVDPTAFLERWRRLALEGRLLTSDAAVLKQLGIDLGTAELTPGEVELLTKANADPAYVIESKRRATAGGSVVRI